MDISLCALNIKTNELKWSGANNPIWVFRKGIKEVDEIEETKADKQPIGLYADQSPFTQHTISLSKGDIIYVFTDGYQDQFGGPKGKKFKPKQLKQLLLNICNKPVGDQKENLITEFRKWQGDQEQVDDVCMIGVRI
jgi:serine phosphatase RsbU (regulator of sigma subunit)